MENKTHKKYVLSPSILAADFSRLGEEIKAVEDAGATYLHVDVMDGIFVPSISFGMPVIASIRNCTKLIFDVHLMITEPERYVEDFINCGADIITLHLETLKEPEKVIAYLRSRKVKVGLSVNPKTNIEEVFPYLHLVDMVLIMTVQPGFGGQKYLDYCTEKIVTLYEQIKKNNLMVDIEVDGGINEETLPIVLEAGANVIVAGSSVFRGDVHSNAERFYRKIECFQKKCD
jgi:ribulose-phosphate 3-epimerase